MMNQEKRTADVASDITLDWVADRIKEDALLTVCEDLSASGQGWKDYLILENKGETIDAIQVEMP